MTAHIVLAFLAILSIGGGSDQSQTKTQTLKFASGGTLRFVLRTGDVRFVKGTDPQHIHLRYTPKSRHPDFAERVRLRFEVHGSEAEIEFKSPHDGEIDTEVEVPSPTNLHVRLSVGDLSVEGIGGNKDLQVHVGDIKVNPGATPDYSDVDASTHIGDIDGSSWGEPKGWLGRSLKFHGNGQYQMHVHAGIGDISFASK